MLFLEKMNQTQKIIWDFQPNTVIKVLGSSEEEFNYRNKSVYTFNHLDSQLDEFTFKIIGLDHIKIIQYINLVVNTQYRVKQGVFTVTDIFIKNNWREEYQICLAISCLDTEKLDEIIKFIFSVIKRLVNDLNIKIVSGYYFLENKKVGLKDKEFHLFFGQSKLVEQITLQDLNQKPVTHQVQISPHSFSRINYQNSVHIYQKMSDLVASLPQKYRLVLFGRDLYFPLHILKNLETAESIYGITHCPITFRDIQEDPDASLHLLCQLVNKKDYISYLQRYLDSFTGALPLEPELPLEQKKFVLVLTAGRNGLGRGMCKFLNENRKRIHRIMYISCNVENMKKDFSSLLPTYTVDDIWISNEFSHTKYSNNIAWLE